MDEREKPPIEPGPEPDTSDAAEDDGAPEPLEA